MRRRARSTGGSLAAVVVTALAGCFSAEPPDGVIACGPVERPCPAGYFCAGDHTCRRSDLLGDQGNPDDLGASADLSPTGPHVRPLEITVPIGRSHYFSSDEAVTWSVGESGGGVISADGRYVAPDAPGDYTVVATRPSLPSAPAAQTVARVHVRDLTLEIVAGQPGGFGRNDGVSTNARFRSPACLTYDGSKFVYVCDAASIRRIDVTTQEVITLAGAADTPGYHDDASGSAARFTAPIGIGLDAGALYVSDENMIRKIGLVAPYPVTTFIGVRLQPDYVNGTASSARLSSPHDLVVVGATMYLADTGNQVLRKIVLPGGQVSLFSGTPKTKGGASGAATSTTFSDPVGLTIRGSNLYVAERSGQTLRQVSTTDGSSTVVAGAYNMPGHTVGAPLSARFNAPTWITNNPDVTEMYLSDSVGVVAVTLNTGPVDQVVAYGGVPIGPLAFVPGSSPSNGSLFIASGAAVVANKGSPAGGTLSTFAGRAPVASSDPVFAPWGMAADGDTAYFANGAVVRRVSLGNGQVGVYAGSGTPGTDDGALQSARFGSPSAVHLVDKILYVADGNLIRKIDTAAASPRVDTLGNLGTHAQLGTPRTAGQLTDDGAGTLYVSTGDALLRLSTAGGTAEAILPELVDAQGISGRGSIAFHAGRLYGDDFDRLFVFDLTSGMLSSLAGLRGVHGDADGIGDAVAFNGLAAVAVGPDGLLYVSDEDNGLIRRVDPQTRAVTTFAGVSGQLAVIPGASAQARLNGVNRLTVRPDGTLLMTSTENVLLRLKP